MLLGESHLFAYFVLWRSGWLHLLVTPAGYT